MRTEDRDDLALRETRNDGALDVRMGGGRIAVAGPCHALLEELELVLGGQEEMFIEPDKIVVRDVAKRVREALIEGFVEF